MKFRLILLLMLVGAVSISPALADTLPSTEPEAVGLSSERLNLIDAVLEADIEKGKIEGAVVLVARKGKIAYFKNFGLRHKKAGLPMEKDTLFRIYSMTKPVVAVATMILFEEGKLLLSDPVSQYIPAFKDVKVAVYGQDAAGKVTRSTVAAESPVTIYQLLTHTSGLTYGWSVPKPFQGEYYKVGLKSDWTIAEQADAIAKLPLQFQPGTQYMYSRSFDILGRVVEVVSGMPLDQFLEQRIYQPLGMKDSGFNVSADELDRVAYLDPKTFLYTDLSKPTINFSGGGGAVSTAMDFANFAQMLLNRGRLNGTRLLGPATVDYMSADHLGPLGNRPDSGYTPGMGFGNGFGFYVRVTDAAPFLGNVGEYYKGGYGGTCFWIDPNEDLFAVFMVSAPAHRLAYRYLIKTMIYQAIEE